MMGLLLLVTSPASCKLLTLICMSHLSSCMCQCLFVFLLCVYLRVCCRPAVQSSGESYGGLTEDSLGDAYNSSKDGTLMMREVMNAHTGFTHTQTHTSHMDLVSKE